LACLKILDTGHSDELVELGLVELPRRDDRSAGAPGRTEGSFDLGEREYDDAGMDVREGGGDR
jgi:hypothetical protein